MTVIDNGGVFDHVSRDPRVTNGWFGEPEMEGHHYISGVAGDQVSGVVLHTVDGDVTASTTDDLWAAWWPAASDTPTDTGPTGATLTLTNGSRSSSTPPSWKNSTTWIPENKGQEVHGAVPA